MDLKGLAMYISSIWVFYELLSVSITVMVNVNITSSILGGLIENIR